MVTLTGLFLQCKFNHIQLWMVGEGGGAVGLVDTNQGRIQKIQKEGAEETDDAVLHHSGSICNQTLRLNVKNTGKKGGGGARPPRPPPLNPPL